MYEWQCSHCDVTHRADTPGEVTTNGQEHLLTSHRAILVSQFKNDLTGSHCQACDYRFPTDSTEIESFECPTCGFENLGFYASKEVWPGIKKR